MSRFMHSWTSPDIETAVAGATCTSPMGFLHIWTCLIGRLWRLLQNVRWNRKIKNNENHCDWIVGNWPGCCWCCCGYVHCCCCCCCCWSSRFCWLYHTTTVLYLPLLIGVNYGTGSCESDSIMFDSLAAVNTHKSFNHLLLLIVAVELHNTSSFAWPWRLGQGSKSCDSDSDSRVTDVTGDMQWPAPIKHIS